MTTYSLAMPTVARTENSTKCVTKHGISRIEGLHCFAFYIGNDAFEEQQDASIETFFITDFLARHFETFLLRPLGIDKHPELKDMYFWQLSQSIVSGSKPKIQNLS